ncbi:MAG: nucleoside triphosphate pyrophosphohydrolase, partial [bacterium]
MAEFTFKDTYTIEDLRGLLRVLRGEGGCPWDRAQTHESIRRDLLEEAYEVVEAIDEGSPEHLREELGDLLENLLFHVTLEEEAGRFTFEDVADEEVKKLIHRHPHVFGDARAADAGEVLVNWDTLKRQEKGQTTVSDAMRAVAKSLPATWRAEKIQKKARKVGFDWPDPSGAYEKVAEELREVQAASRGEGDLDEELGDLLFACVNLVRLHKRDPEEVLNA